MRKYVQNKNQNSIIYDHDILFWCGDLNYRIENLSKSAIEEMINDNIKQNKKGFDILIENDQLINERKKRNVFLNFQEAKINFAPTFKFDVGMSTINCFVHL